MARCWLHAADYYGGLMPTVFRRPRGDGLADWFEAELSRGRGDAELLLVGEVERQVVGFLAGQLAPPAPDAEWQFVRDLGERRLLVDAVAVAAAHRHRGVGSSLLRAAEDWGRRHGATRARLDTFYDSPLSVPYETLGYRRRALVFDKSLAP